MGASVEDIEKKKKQIEAPPTRRDYFTIPEFRKISEWLIYRRVADECYPPTLEVLVKGIYRPGDNVMLVFLERIPNDPMTGEADWELRSIQDPPDSTTWGGQKVAKVCSSSKDVAIDGAKYKDW